MVCHRLTFFEHNIALTENISFFLRTNLFWLVSCDRISAPGANAGRSHSHQSLFGVDDPDYRKSSSIVDTVLWKAVVLSSNRNWPTSSIKILLFSINDNDILKFCSYHRNGCTFLELSHYVGLLDKIHLIAHKEVVIKESIRMYNIWADCNRQTAS